jgi:hypothetical protein
MKAKDVIEILREAEPTIWIESDGDAACLTARLAGLTRVRAKLDDISVVAAGPHACATKSLLACLRSPLAPPIMLDGTQARDVAGATFPMALEPVDVCAVPLPSRIADTAEGVAIDAACRRAIIDGLDRDLRGGGVRVSAAGACATDGHRAIFFGAGGAPACTIPHVLATRVAWVLSAPGDAWAALSDDGDLECYAVSPPWPNVWGILADVLKTPAITVRLPHARKAVKTLRRVRERLTLMWVGEGWGATAYPSSVSFSLPAYSDECPPTIGVDAGYLADAIEYARHVTSDAVDVHVRGALDPILVTGAELRTAIVMPCRIG